MARFDWLSELLARLEDEHILVRRGSHTQLAPAHVFYIDREDWGRIAQQTVRYGCRWCALWAEELTAIDFPEIADELEVTDSFFLITVCLEKEGDYLILRTQIPYKTPILISQTLYYPAANRSERHTHDLFGVTFLQHPDERHWTRHQAWGAEEYPLRKHFPKNGQNPPDYTPPDSHYPFLQAQGIGVYEIPVGPVHAGIIEPGHFRFQAVGETILHVEQHLGYVHKGVEKIAEGRTAQELARLAARVSGDSTVAHTWAACMAMERAIHLKVPPRALLLRAIIAERERIANHLGDIGAICNDVAFAFAHYQLARLRELWQRLNQKIWGHRLLMDVIIPGGVRVDLSAEQITLQQSQIQRFREELIELAGILERHTGLEDRLATTGVLTTDQASQLGCLGYVGRASGQNYDVRRDSPYSPYHQFQLEVPVLRTGDVEARVQIRIAEINHSLHLLTQLLEQLPNGEIATTWHLPSKHAEGLGIIEGWRGEIVTFVRFGAEGKISRYYPRDPSWLNWPALELMIQNNIVPDFPVCNKSVNGSYSGHDL